MPAKKAPPKRGKAAVKVETVTDSEELKQTKVQNEPKLVPNMDATFIVENGASGEKGTLDGGSDNHGADVVSSKREDQLGKLGNGDAQEFDKIEEADEEEAKGSTKAKVKGRGASKKNKRAEPEPESDHQEDGIDEEIETPRSPKRPREEDSEEEATDEQPAKRSRGKGGRKAVVAKKQPKTKAESETVADEEDANEEISPDEAAMDVADEIAPPKRGRNVKASATNKARKDKNVTELEPSENEPTTNKSSPAEESPVEADEDDSSAKVVKEKVEPTKKRGGVRAPKEKSVPEPTTRSTRSRKPVTYEEPLNDNAESDDEDIKRPKKVTTKKAPAKKKNNATLKGITKKKGRPAKTVSDNDKDEEADE